MKQEKNTKEFKIFCIVMGFFLVAVGVYQIINIKEYKPNFDDRWGTITYLIYSIFGPYGEPCGSVLFGVYLFYVAFLKSIKK